MADKKFTLFHLSLIERLQHSMFWFEGTREEWLRFSLRDGFTFSHRKGELHWVPQGEENGSIVGLIQRSIKHARHEPPELGGAEIIADEWQGAYVIIDPTHHGDGQKAAVENDFKSGKPAALMNSLAELKARGYAVVEEPGRRIIREELASGGSALPWLDLTAFLRRAIDMALADLAAAEDHDGWVFFDRGLIDAASALEALTGDPVMRSLCTEHRYHPSVFTAPPWPEI